MKICALVELPTMLKVAGNCLGREFEMRVGELLGVVRTPEATWQSELPQLSLHCKVPDPFGGGRATGVGSEHFWGSVQNYSPGPPTLIWEAYLEVLLADFEVEHRLVSFTTVGHETYPSGSTVDAIRDGIEHWAQRLCSWNGVMSGQYSGSGDPKHRMRTTHRPHIWAEGKEANRGATCGSSFEITVGSPGASLDLTTLDNAIQFASTERVIPLQHELLANAFNALHEANFNYAVMLAGLAAELELKTGTTPAIGKSKTPCRQPCPRHCAVRAKGPRDPTLGQLVIARNPATRDKSAEYVALVEPRNRLMHDGQSVTADVATEALLAARKILESSRLRLLL